MREKAVPSVMWVLAEHLRLLAPHDFLWRIGILNHDDLPIFGQQLQVGVELLLKICAGQIIFIAVRFPIGEQGGVQDDKPCVRSFPAAAEG